MKDLPCISCGKGVEPSYEDEGVTVDNVDHLGFMDGMAGKISCGYGSALDGNVYMIAVCDDCTRKLHAEGKLTYCYNYIP